MAADRNHAGTAEVWVVDPAWRTVSIYRSANDMHTLTEGDELVPPLPQSLCDAVQRNAISFPLRGQVLQHAVGAEHRTAGDLMEVWPWLVIEDHKLPSHLPCPICDMAPVGT